VLSVPVAVFLMNLYESNIRPFVPEQEVLLGPLRCGGFRAIRCDLRLKACRRLYVGQLAVFYWVLRERVAACSQ
jgi:hypothetical protein